MTSDSLNPLLPLEEAAEIIGLQSVYLKKLAKKLNVEVILRDKKAWLSWENIRRLAKEQTPAWSLLSSENYYPEPLPVPLQNFPLNTLQQGSCLTWMRNMPKNFVQAIVTSPPYWGVRRYKNDQRQRWYDGSQEEFGLEASVDDYIRHTTEILLLAKRVLREDGVIWWNLADTYQTRAVIRESSTERLHAFEGKRRDTWKSYPVKRYSSGHPYLKDKDLTLVPFHVALAAQRIGLYVRSVIVWSKENTLPESVKDRATNSHEYILMLTKSRRYFYNPAAAKENNTASLSDRNFRSVWTFPTSAGTHPHSAAFPEELPRRCILASTRPQDIVFDPFVGSGTTTKVAQELQRQYFGCDLSQDYIASAQERHDKVK